MNKKLIRLTESDLHRIVRESVNKVLKEEEGIFHSEPNLYNDAYPTRNGIDMYTLGSHNNKVKPIYFHTKAEAMDWIKDNVTDQESLQALKDALSQYRLHDAGFGNRYINQVSSNLDTHKRLHP